MAMRMPAARATIAAVDNVANGGDMTSRKASNTVTIRNPRATSSNIPARTAGTRRLIVRRTVLLVGIMADCNLWQDPWSNADPENA